MNATPQQDPQAAPERDGIFTGYHGTLDPVRLDIQDDRRNQPYAKVPIILTDGREVNIMAFGQDKIDMLKAELAKGGVSVVHGYMETRGHLKLHEIGMRRFEGTVSNLRRGDTPAGPWFNAMLSYQDDGRKFSAPFSAFGEHAEALKGVEDGQAVRLTGHFTRQRAGDDFRKVIHVLAAAAVDLAKEKKIDDSPEP